MCAMGDFLLEFVFGQDFPQVVFQMVLFVFSGLGWTNKPLDSHGYPKHDYDTIRIRIYFLRHLDPR